MNYLKRKQGEILRTFLLLCCTLALACSVFVLVVLMLPEPAEDSLTVTIVEDAGQAADTGESGQAEDTAGAEDTAATQVVSTVDISLTAAGMVAALEQSVGMEQDGIERYMYTQMNLPEKLLYLTIVQAVMQMDEEVVASAKAGTDVSSVWLAVRADYPEFFWIHSNDISTKSGYTDVDGTLVGVQVSFQYTMTMQERDEIQLVIDEKADAFLQTIDPAVSEYEKVKAVYEHVVQTLSYNIEMLGFGIDVAFLYDEAVCEGYSRMTQYLLGRLGVCAVYVFGPIIEEGSEELLEGSEEENVSYHAWNIVRIEGEYYYIDTTSGEGYLDWVNYTYLCLNDEDFAEFHEAYQGYRLPEVTGTTYQYYQVEGLYLEEYSDSAFLAALQMQGNTDCYTMRFSSTEELARAVSAQITDKAIYDALRSVGVNVSSIKYVRNTDFNVLTIYIS